MTDYVEIVQHILNFDDGNRRQCFNIIIQDDQISENVEEFTISYAASDARVVVIPSSTTITITDDIASK